MPDVWTDEDLFELLDAEEVAYTYSRSLEDQPAQEEDYRGLFFWSGFLSGSIFGVCAMISWKAFRYVVGS